MELVPVRDLRLHPGQVWKRLGQGREIVVTAKGQPIALLTSIVGGDVEKALRAIRMARTQIALGEIRDEAHQKGLDRLSVEEIDTLIKKTRRTRRRPL